MSTRSVRSPIAARLAAGILLAAGLAWTVAGRADVLVAGNVVDYSSIADGAGGAAFCWTRVEGGTARLFVQRYDVRSQAVFPAGGVPVTGPSSTSQGFASVVLAAPGSFVVVWLDGRDVRTQRFDEDGDKLWGPDGVRVSVGPWSAAYPCVAPDGLGGVYVAWIEDFDHLFVQHLTEDGIPVLAQPRIIRIGGRISDLKIASVPGADGAILAWNEEGSLPNYSAWANRVDANGNTYWPSVGGAGVQLSESVNNVLPGLSIVPGADGSARIVFARRVYLNGDPTHWSIEGRRVSATGDVTPLDLGSGLASVTDVSRPSFCLMDAGADRTFLMWTGGGGSAWELGARRIAAGGGATWSRIVSLDMTNDLQSARGPSSAWEGPEDFLITWVGAAGLKVGKLSFAGYPTGGVWEQVVHTGAWLRYPHVVADGTGGGIVSVIDNYAEPLYGHMLGDLRFTHVYDPTVPVAITSNVDIADPTNFVRSCPAGDDGTLRVFVDFDERFIARPIAAQDLQLYIQPIIDPNNWWIWGFGPTFTLGDATAANSYTTTLLHTSLGGRGEGRAGVLLHGIGIGETRIRIKSPDFTANGRVDAADVGLMSQYLAANDPRADFAAYPPPTDGVVNLADVGFFSAHLGHRASAGAGPEGSGSALAGPQDGAATGAAAAATDPGAPTLRGRLLAPARPNPFLGNTTLCYVLDSERWVELHVLDLQGRLVRRLAEGFQPAGEHAIPWDGTDDEGRKLPGGVYLCRLLAGSDMDSRRIVRLGSGR